MFSSISDFFKSSVISLGSLFQNRPTQPAPELVRAQEPALRSEPLSMVPKKVTSKEWYHDGRIDDYAEKIVPNLPLANQISVRGNSYVKTENFKLLVENPANNLKRVERERKNYQNKTQLIFPLNSGAHYELYILDKQSSSVYHMDSLNYPMNQEWANRISDYAKIIWPEEENTLFAIEKIQMPHQGNGVDCGPAVCQMMHHIATKGLKDLLEWAKQHETYDYSQFREEIDAQLGMHVPLRVLVSTPALIKSSSASSDSDVEIVGEKKINNEKKHTLNSTQGRAVRESGSKRQRLSH